MAILNYGTHFAALENNSRRRWMDQIVPDINNTIPYVPDTNGGVPQEVPTAAPPTRPTNQNASARDQQNKAILQRFKSEASGAPKTVEIRTSALRQFSLWLGGKHSAGLADAQQASKEQLDQWLVEYATGVKKDKAQRVTKALESLRTGTISRQRGIANPAAPGDEEVLVDFQQTATWLTPDTRRDYANSLRALGHWIYTHPTYSTSLGGLTELQLHPDRDLVNAVVKEFAGPNERRLWLAQAAVANLRIDPAGSKNLRQILLSVTDNELIMQLGEGSSNPPAPHTVDSYRSELRGFAAWLSSAEEDLQWIVNAPQEQVDDLVSRYIDETGLSRPRMHVRPAISLLRSGAGPASSGVGQDDGS